MKYYPYFYALLFGILSLSGCISDSTSSGESVEGSTQHDLNPSHTDNDWSMGDQPMSSEIEVSSSSELMSSSSESVQLVPSQDCGAKALACGTFIDTRDSKEYQWTQIGDHLWMAQDLAYRGAGYTCPYGIESNCSDNGEHYTWEQATESDYYIYGREAGICPAGWYIPSRTVWESMFDFMVENGVSRGYYAEAMKVVTDGQWGGMRVDDSDYPNEFGFSAIETGYIDSTQSHISGPALWWSTSSGYYKDENYTPQLWVNTEKLDHDAMHKSFAVKLRCVLDAKTIQN
jgi:uncharacterized protein (TIGR02145 family)